MILCIVMYMPMDICHVVEVVDVSMDNALLELPSTILSPHLRHRYYCDMIVKLLLIRLDSEGFMILSDNSADLTNIQISKYPNFPKQLNRGNKSNIL